MKAHIVQPEDIAYIWEEVAPLLDRVKEHSEGELETEATQEIVPAELRSLQIGKKKSDGKIDSIEQ